MRVTLIKRLAVSGLATAMVGAGLLVAVSHQGARADVTTAAPTGNGTGVAVLSGDFTGDGETDLAVTGSQYFASVPVAESTGDGAFSTTAAGGLGTFPHMSSEAGARQVTGDFNGDGKTDIALLPPVGDQFLWSKIPVAFSAGNGSFTVTNRQVDTAAAPFVGLWDATPGVQPITGDFNGDGKTDIALVSGQNWTSLPVAYSNGDGTFRVVADGLTDTGFMGWAAVAGVRVRTGDFNGDGRTDIALVPPPGTPWWYTLPVAFATAQGTFSVTNTAAVGDFALSWAQTAGVQVISGDFNGDGRTDIALVGGPGWTSVPVAYSNGDGTFRVVTDGLTSTDFAGWDAVAGVRVRTGDFNGDGRTDIALVPPPGTPWWYTLPVAFATAQGTFTVTNTGGIGDFTLSWAQTAGVQVISGDFNGDGRTDIALLGGAGWADVRIASSAGNGTFSITDYPVPSWASYLDGVPGNPGDFNLATCAGLHMCQSADVNRDGRPDQVGFVPATTATAGMAGAVLVDIGNGWQPWGTGFCVNPDETCQILIVDNVAAVVQYENDTPGMQGEVFSAQADLANQRFSTPVLVGHQ